MSASSPRPPRWYAEVGRFEWLMLAIASAGWFFDVFEGQIFNLTSGQLLPDLLHCAADAPAVVGCGAIGCWPCFWSAGRPAACCSASWPIGSAASR